MALNVNRWISYAKARLETAVSDGNRELDRLEAERDAELAEKPWLSPSGGAPTLDEVRARIEWEAAKAERSRPGGPDPDASAPPSAPPGAARPPIGTTPDGHATPDRDVSAAQARVELDAQRKAVAERLDAIRAELGASPEDPPQSP